MCFLDDSAKIYLGIFISWMEIHTYMAQRVSMRCLVFLVPDYLLAGYSSSGCRICSLFCFQEFSTYVMGIVFYL